MKFQYRQLEESSYYLVFDKDREYATFRLIEAPNLWPEPGCKHMELKINHEITQEIFNSGNITLMIAIFRFVFNSVLEITHELRGYRLCKMYSGDEAICLAYRGFASFLSKKRYDVKMYRGWVEIRKK